MGEIHELFVLALSLVWFAGATPETSKKSSLISKEKVNKKARKGGSGKIILAAYFPCDWPLQ